LNRTLADPDAGLPAVRDDVDGRGVGRRCVDRRGIDYGRTSVHRADADGGRAGSTDADSAGTIGAVIAVIANGAMRIRADADTICTNAVRTDSWTTDTCAIRADARTTGAVMSRNVCAAGADGPGMTGAANSIRADTRTTGAVMACDVCTAGAGRPGLAGTSAAGPVHLARRCIGGQSDGQQAERGNRRDG
jgi:hypothetical protein